MIVKHLTLCVTGNKGICDTRLCATPLITLIVTDCAEELKASYFDVGHAWKSWQIHDKLGANYHFLDIIAEKGDTIKLAVAKQRMNPKSNLKLELDYLTEHKGYYWVDDYTLKRL